MAKKRMFSLGVLETDAFLDMPLSAQALYFHLSLRADDDGFIGNPKRITQNIGASLDDLRILIAKRFVLTFEDGVIVIKHWRMHNTIKKDRYTATNYSEDLNLLHIKENGAYTFREDCGAQLENKWSADGAQMEHLSSTGLGIGIDKDKNSIGKVSTYRAESEPDSAPEVITIPLNDGSEYAVKQDDFNEWLTLYPAVDVMQELRKMRGWSQVNGAKRKTRKGIKRFIVNWLAREQDKPHAESQRKTGSGENPFLQMMRESENERTGNAEDINGFAGGIPDVLPGVEGW